MRVVKPGAKLLSVTPEAEELIERCGRICYKSDDTDITELSARKFIKKLVKSGHHSVFEHASATFLIVCDRGISHEIVRHRMASYSMESSRYCNYSKDKFSNEITVIKPSQLDTVQQMRLWSRQMVRAENAYFNLLKEGAKPEAARSVLPTCLKTELSMTANFREWRHFLNLRLLGTTGRPHPDVKIIAAEIGALLVGAAPSVFSDCVESQP